MARKPKNLVENKPAEDAVTPSANGKMSAPETKKRAAPAGKKKKTIAPKKPSRKPAASRPVEPTDDEIRLRAYFLAERRHQLSLPGDSAHDWVEARRQLIKEASR